jgi:membrane-associated protease RseP (regulator of RpoE activity)
VIDADRMSTSPWPPPSGPAVTDENYDEIIVRKPADALKGGGLMLIALLVVAGLMGGWSILAVIAAFVVMIFLHELGHYLAARWSGMKATEFFLGFGPKIWSFRRGETEFGVKAIPLGAYVKVIGMNNIEEVPEADEPRTYRQARFRDRFNLTIAGSMMHFAQAIVLLFLLFAFVGVPSSEVWSVDRVVANSAAEQAGVEPGDRITAIDGVVIASFTDMTDYVRERPGETVRLTIDRQGETVGVDAVLKAREDDPTEGFLGVAGDFPGQTVSAPVAAKDAVVRFGPVMRDTVQGLGRFFSPSFFSAYLDRVFTGAPEGEEVNPESGLRPSDENRPVSILGAGRVADQAVTSGWGEFFAFMAGMNIVIGIFNLLPLLPLDGGHAVVAIYEKVRSRGGRRYHADIRKLMPVAYGTVLLLGFIFLSSLFLDITSPLPNLYAP